MELKNKDMEELFKFKSSTVEEEDDDEEKITDWTQKNLV